MKSGDIRGGELVEVGHQVSSGRVTSSAEQVGCALRLATSQCLLASHRLLLYGHKTPTSSKQATGEREMSQR